MLVIWNESMDHGENICTMEIESIAHQRFVVFFFPSGIQLLDSHQQVTVSISDIGREQGEGLVESESQKRETENKKEWWSKLSEALQESLGLTSRSLVTFGRRRRKKNNSLCKVTGWDHKTAGWRRNVKLERKRRQWRTHTHAATIWRESCIMEVLGEKVHKDVQVEAGSGTVIEWSQEWCSEPQKPRGNGMERSTCCCGASHVLWEVNYRKARDQLQGTG